ncbi:MAG: hypothetical protein QXL94_05455, partial [Candidatus Parvarchaeum sp.]
MWYVEHVFWRYYLENKEIPEETTITVKETEQHKVKVPPQITDERSIIPTCLMDYVKLSFMEGKPSDFEKKTAILFTALGFETILKGQGQGRVTDVIAIANTARPYIVLIDCKARSGKDFKFALNDERA